MAPLAIYIEQVQNHEPASPSARPNVTVYPPSPPRIHNFGSLRSAPTLVKIRTNRILTYVGSFNPPHRGHLHLLKHVFMRGTHDMNVIAAIIIPSSDKSVAKKMKAKGEKLVFSREMRCFLWEQDLCFPPWACVYENNTTSFTKFSERLTQATEKDGYRLEFVPLYRADNASPDSPPNPTYGCKTIIMSDAARAASYQSSSGRLRDFDGCTKWGRIRVDKDNLQRYAEGKAHYAMKALWTLSPQQAFCMLNHGHWHMEYMIETSVAKAVKELEAVLICKRQVRDQTVNLRFVKCEDVDPRKAYNDISSTGLREVMSTESGIKLEEALSWMALSSHILWPCKAWWKASLGAGCCCKFPESIKGFASPEEFSLCEQCMLDQEFTSSEVSLSPEELGLAEVVETSPSFEDPESHDISPSFEEPQSFEVPQLPKETPGTNHKKRHFSATGLEAKTEI